MKKQRLPGDCFVVMRNDATHWNGSEWVDDWQDAIQFASGHDPSGEARELCDEVRKRGFICNVAYIPRPRRRVTKEEHDGEA